MAASLDLGEKKELEELNQAEETVDEEQVYLDPQLDKRLDRKFDLHIVPWLFGIW